MILSLVHGFHAEREDPTPTFRSAPKLHRRPGGELGWRSDAREFR
jgi:hypothetical protein